MVRESLLVGFFVCALPLACGGETLRRQRDRDVSGAAGDDDGGGQGGSAGLSAGRAGAAGRAGSASGGAAGSSGGGASGSGGAGNAAGTTSPAGSGEGGEGATSGSGGNAGSGGSAGSGGNAGSGGLGFVNPVPAPGSLHDLASGDTLNSTPPVLLRFEDGLLIAGYTSDPALAGVAFATDQVAETFVARLDHTGDRLWSKPLPGSGVPIAMKLDPEGNIVIVAAYLPDRTQPISSSFSTDDLYLAKLRPNGDTIYARDIPYDSGVVPYGLVVDAEGASYVCGGYFSPDSSGRILTFLAKYDPDGDEVWVKKIPHTGTWASADGIALLANGDVAITGGFNGTIDFGGGALSTLAVSGTSMGSNGFIARFTPGGEHVESTRFGGTLYDSGKDLVALSDGDLLVSGSMSGISEIGGKTADGAEGSPFVARLDPEGAARFVAIAHTSGTPYALVADPDEQTFHLTGWFGQNYFLWEFGADGEVGRGAGVNGSLIWSHDIAVDSLGSLWVSGGFQYAVDFGNGISLTAADKGVFLVRLERETR
jgi:hypothetical protein